MIDEATEITVLRKTEDHIREIVEIMIITENDTTDRARTTIGRKVITNLRPEVLLINHIQDRATEAAAQKDEAREVPVTADHEAGNNL